MKSFAQKVAVVTGAGLWHGPIPCHLTRRAGADVVICDVNTETLGETEKNCCNVTTSPFPRSL